jgi:2-deoxy-D-gluconate 3-dehydrogenase
LLDEFSLKGKVALVTGGNGGIGLGIALGLAAAGADIVIAARNREKTAEAASRLQSLGRRVLEIECDVQSRSDIEATVAAAERELGGVDVLVNNAGIAAGGPPQAINEDVWQRVLDTNLKAALVFAQACYPLMVRRGGGKVINIGSEYAIFGSPTVLPYSVSKGGVVQLTKSLAIAWAKDNIQVNCIIPGWVRTDMTSAIMRNEAVYRRIVERTPAGRFAEPEEMAGAAVFLASRASDFITGQSLPVDGGYSIS